MESNIFNASKDSILYFINDKNKNKRWIFPSSLENPTFLNLYNSSTFKGCFYKQLVKLIFKFKLQRYFVSGIIQGALNPKYKNILKELNCTNYSVFTGTAGENRKIVIEANNGKDTKYFIKIPTTDGAKELVQQERENLKYLEQFDFKNFEIPKVLFSYEETIAISNIKPEQVVKSDKLSDIHFKVFDELYHITSKKSNLVNISCINKSIINIENLSAIELDLNNVVHKKIEKLKTNLLNLKKFIIEEQEINISFSHHDFTPWNMYVTKDRLYIYDWELASYDTPLLFDFFHYIFQQSILIKHKSYKEIKEEINISLKNEILKDILKNYKVDINDYYGYYLIINISYYALKYVGQKDLHIQAYWLIDVWNDALSDFIEKEGEVFGK